MTNILRLAFDLRVLEICNLGTINSDPLCLQEENFVLVAFILFRSFLLNKELTAPRLSFKLNLFLVLKQFIKAMISLLSN